MPRETILTSSQGDDEQDRDLRPQRIREMIGQRDVIERLFISIDAAQRRGEALGHILFDGPPGLGKTTFAICIPQELNVPISMANGAGLRAPKDLIPYLTNLEARAVLFIDEIHRLPSPVEEYLYTAMEDFRIDIVLGEGVNARTLNLSLKPFTLIGATTRAGKLSGPLRDRFHMREHLGFYTDDELAQIVVRNAAKLNVKISSDAAVELAQRSRGTPRIVNMQLRWVRDYADCRGDGTITLEAARAALRMAGVDDLGLNRLDRTYLETIVRVFHGGPVGVDAVAHTMNVSVDTLSDEVEPFLLRSEFLVRTPRGRMATTKTFEHLKMLPPDRDENSDQGRLFD